jgi:hypothetical protein
MAVPTLTPASTTSAIVLTSAGVLTDVNTACPYKIYSQDGTDLYSDQFVSGAVDQVAHVFKKLGGDVLDIELTTGNVYAAYEEAVLEYSYIVNVHQATNILSDALGNQTGSFDHKGILEAGDLSSSLGGKHVALTYPKFDYAMTRRIAEGVSAEIGLKGGTTYSGSFDIVADKQDYDLQTILEEPSNTGATGSVTIVGIDGDAFNETTVTITSTDGTRKIYEFSDDAGGGAPATLSENRIAVKVGNDDSAPNIASRLQTAIQHALGHNGKIVVSRASAVLTLTQAKGGDTGNTAIVSTAGALATKVDFTGGATATPYAEKIDGKKILIKKVYYKTPHAMWRFFGYYGGLNVVGNLHNYGQFSDDSTFQLVPTWHNKAQALAFEDAIYTRMSHFSYEIRNGSLLRIYPIPRGASPSSMWVEFSIPEDVWAGDDKSITGVNNLNTLPMGNLPYNSINAIGKQWIRRYALAICKEMLGQIRSKFGGVPIPGDNVTLNGDALLGQAKEEQSALREELKTTLAELTYAKMAESDAGMLENSQKALQQVPNYIFVG